MTTPEISNGSSNGFDVRPFTNKETVPANATNFRLSIHRWKETTDKKTKIVTPAKPSVFVCVPQIIVTILPASLQSALQAAVDELQDDMIRERIEAKVTTFTPADVNADKLAEFSAAKLAGARLNKEIIGTWFDNDLQDILIVAFSEKLGIGATPSQEDSARIGAIVSKHRALLCELAAPKPSIQEDTAKSLLRAVELAGDGSIVKTQITAKLTSLSKPADLSFIGLDV